MCVFLIGFCVFLLLVFYCVFLKIVTVEPPSRWHLPSNMPMSHAAGGGLLQSNGSVFRAFGMAWGIMIDVLRIPGGYKWQDLAMVFTFLKFSCTKRYCYTYLVIAMGSSYISSWTFLCGWVRTYYWPFRVFVLDQIHRILFSQRESKGRSMAHVSGLR